MLTGLPLLNKLWQTREEQQAPVRAFCEALEEAKRSAVEHVASAVLAGELENLEGEQAKLTQRYLDWSALWRRYTDEVGGRVGGGDDLLQQHNQRLGALRGEGEQQSATLKEQIERGRALERLILAYRSSVCRTIRRTCSMSSRSVTGTSEAIT